MATALTRRERFDVPELFRRWFDESLTTSWLRVEEYVDDDALVVRAELPDIDPDEDVDVSIADGMLHIHARREEKSEHKDKATYRSEFRYGSFDRSVPLPRGAAEEDIAATYKDGVLEVRVPLPEEVAPASVKIPIERG